MVPFGDGGGDGDDGEEEARWGWDPLRSGSAPPTMNGTPVAAMFAADGLFGGGGAGAGGGSSFFSWMGGGSELGARLDEVSRPRGTGIAEDFFGNSASLSNKGLPAPQLNVTGEFDGPQFGPSRVHSVGAIPNHSTLDMGPTWTEANADSNGFHRHIQNRFVPNMEKMNSFGRRDLDSTYPSDSDLSDALSGLRLSNSTTFDERRPEKLFDEMLKCHRAFNSKIADGSRSLSAGNILRAPRSENLDFCSAPIYGDGILRWQNNIIDGPIVPRMNHHRMNNADHLTFADKLTLMQLGNLHGEANYLRDAAATNYNSPLSNRNNTITDLDLAGNRKAYLEDNFVWQCLQNDNSYLPKSGLSYSDNRLYHEDPRSSYPRTQRSGSHFHPNLGSIPCHGDQQSSLFSLKRRAPDRNMVSQSSQDNPVAHYLDSLDIANRNSAGSLELVDVIGHVMEISVDQYGSRFIQQKLEEASADDREKIFPEILSNAIALTTDVFGNYVIQKFFEFATDVQLSKLADKLDGHILELSFQMYGCRVVQKVIEVVDMNRKIDIVHELKNSVLRCIADQNGNHVIQKCIECVPEDRIPFVIEAILSQIFVLCGHQYGCRVIQRVLEHCHDPATQSAVMDEIVQHTCALTQDKFGNYVVQHVLQHGKPEERSSIIQKLSGQVVAFSTQKYASNVVEKCLTYGTPDERDGLVKEIVSSSQTFQGLMKDQYGNYVVQRVLQTCDDKYLEMILSSIKVHLNELKKYTYGKHFVARVEKLIITGENRVRMASKTWQSQQPPNCTDVDANPL